MFCWYKTFFGEGLFLSGDSGPDRTAQGVAATGAEGIATPGLRQSNAESRRPHAQQGGYPSSTPAYTAPSPLPGAPLACNAGSRTARRSLGFTLRYRLSTGFAMAKQKRPLPVLMLRRRPAPTAPVEPFGTLPASPDVWRLRSASAAAEGSRAIRSTRPTAAERAAR